MYYSNKINDLAPIRPASSFGRSLSFGSRLARISRADLFSAAIVAARRAQPQKPTGIEISSSHAWPNVLLFKSQIGPLIMTYRRLLLGLGAATVLTPAIALAGSV